jgi:hypothetical protein
MLLLTIVKLWWTWVAFQQLPLHQHAMWVAFVAILICVP